MRKYFNIVAIALAFALVAAACSSDETVDAYCRTDSEAEAMDADPDPDKLDEGATTDCYVGLSTEDAGELADSSDRPWRIVSQDGEDFAVTMDFLPTRLNFTVVDDEITIATLG